MLLKALTEHFVELLHAGVAGLRLVELDWGQLELTGSVLTDPAALVSIEEMTYKEDSGGTDYGFVLTVKLAWTRYDQLSATNPKLGERLENLDLVDEVRELLEGYRNGDRVRRLHVEWAGLANDQQTNYKHFHKSYECYEVRARGEGYAAHAHETVTIGEVGEGSVGTSGTVRWKRL